jgi:hypothetical protein
MTKYFFLTMTKMGGEAPPCASFVRSGAAVSPYAGPSGTAGKKPPSTASAS